MHIHVLAPSDRLQQCIRIVKEVLGLTKQVSVEYMKQKREEYRPLIEEEG